ncbi:hypothetical protein DOY81_006396 [Sarcophaga bullata]|nr:hypothetical protein DOY81_006396 [Sarcophaga bullata]
MHFLSAAIVLCSSILDLMLNSASLGLLIYIFYSIAALTQLFLYCIGGSYISESSASIAVTLYDIEWYKCDVETRKMILMMLLRSQKATAIVVPFFTPSLSAFSSNKYLHFILMLLFCSFICLNSTVAFLLLPQYIIPAQ